MDTMFCIISLSEPADWVTPASIKQQRQTDAALSSCALAVIVNPQLSVCLRETSVGHISINKHET